MNGAAMNCRQDQVLHSQHRDSRGLRDARYHLQMNHPCEQKFLPHHSKTINTQSDNFPVDSSAECLQRLQTFDSTPPASGNIHDPRTQVRCTRMRKPIDLPVPKFEKDENCVPHPSHGNLDLDTRIDLLIKSKALAGMHPIFSDLVESEDESDDSFTTRPKKTSLSKKRKSFSPVETIVYQDEDDDPDKPLSRPPSPFLSRATYLFWFNKAIELKEQAKAQEQALLEKAIKKLQDNVTPVKPNHVEKSAKENKSFFNSLINEISKEMKEMIKQQFMNEVIESTISNSLDSWWGTEFVQQEQHRLLDGQHNSNPTSMEQRKSTSNHILICRSSNKTVGTSDVHPKQEVFDHKDKLFNEDDSSFNQTSDKLHLNLNLNRCNTVIHPEKLNTTRIDRHASKESPTATSPRRLYINNECANKEKDLIPDEKQDKVHSSVINTEHIKVDSPVPTAIASNTALPRGQADCIVTSTSLDSAVRQNPEEECAMKIENHKSSKHETNDDSQNLTHALKIANDYSSKYESSSVVGNSIITDEKC